MIPLLKPFLFIYQLFDRIIRSGLNERSIIGLILNFWTNFGPVFIWLLIFKNAGLIPHSIRPPIHVALPYHVDTFMFSTWLGGLIFIPMFITISLLMYLGIYKQKGKILRGDVLRYLPLKGEVINEDSSEGSSFEMDSLERGNDLELGVVKSPPSGTNFQNDNTHIGKLTFFNTLDASEVNNMAVSVNEKIAEKQQQYGYNWKIPRNCWYISAPILLSTCWFILNIDYWLREPIRTWKDLLAWTSYVLGHITVPIITAVWLYVFHAPGVLKSYGWALGLQNICGVLTHLIFPCAPPWFIHLYGENAPANYDLPGYAAGLTRVDVALGTHLNSKGFHASPIVFGAVPSLHSAMAVMTFLFVSYYARWTVVKLFSFAFVVLQWWATIYLDHHWRLDLLVGMGYALVWFSIMYKWRLAKVNEAFLQSRLSYNFARGSTMGMRVFRNTKLQWFFDPLS
ncbi:IPT1 [Candida margitis]|uniref:IPT1 n=1 Tax=Candida margitis TaxID=1775924 RepID=UPI002227DE63|nr:IPT1 [Candida margitis]KAI5969949.1 IPT1 [Candida margitis]